jgi:hypothetical protein
MNRTEVIVIVVAVIALIAFLAARAGGPRITQIDRTVRRDDEGTRDDRDA